jgi:hypothetical protein
MPGKYCSFQMLNKNNKHFTHVAEWDIGNEIETRGQYVFKRKVTKYKSKLWEIILS